MSEEIEGLKLYADPACTKPLESIKWQNYKPYKIVLLHGEEVEVPDTILKVQMQG